MKTRSPVLGPAARGKRFGDGLRDVSWALLWALGLLGLSASLARAQTTAQAPNAAPGSNLSAAEVQPISVALPVAQTVDALPPESASNAAWSAGEKAAVNEPSAATTAAPNEVSEAEQPREEVHALPSPADPWESVNRKIFVFNDKIDQALLKPVAQTYQRYTPDFLQTGVNNVFGNLRDVWSSVNLLLQLKPRAGLEMGTRVLINSSLGLYGLIDLATPMGLEKKSEDFGQTLGHWGVASGPYVVLPVLGPSTLRDASAFIVVDRAADLTGELHPITHRNMAAALRVVDQRARLLSASRTMDAISFDRYAFMRDAFLQRRLFQVHDGNLPSEESKD